MEKQAAAGARPHWILCRNKLAHYKAPRSIDFRAELPCHDTGKIYTHLLKTEYFTAENAPAGAAAASGQILNSSRPTNVHQ